MLCQRFLELGLVDEIEGGEVGFEECGCVQERLCWVIVLRLHGVRASEETT